MKKSIFTSVGLMLALLLTGPAVQAELLQNQMFEVEATEEETTNLIEELDPFDPNIEDILMEYDEIYENETGIPAFLDSPMTLWNKKGGSCYRESCAVYIRVVKSEQKGYLYVNGRLESSFKVSTGAPGSGTPNFDRHPNGRIYNAYSSKSYPGGDYNGLGNMPYAIFIQGGFALHGTPKGNWKYLGQRASHGCIRMHPDEAKRFNQLVRQYGIYKTWITVY